MKNIIGKTFIQVIDRGLCVDFVPIKVLKKIDFSTYECEILREKYQCKLRIEFLDDDIKINHNYAFETEKEALDYADILLHQNLHILKNNIDFLRIPVINKINIK